MMQVKRLGEGDDRVGDRGLRVWDGGGGANGCLVLLPLGLGLLPFPGPRHSLDL